MFTASDAQQLEQKVNHTQNHHAVASLQTRLIAKLESWIEISEVKECVFEIPVMERSSLLSKKVICDELIRFLESHGFEVSNRSHRHSSFTIGWKHVGPLAKSLRSPSLDTFSATTLWIRQEGLKLAQNEDIVTALLEECNAMIRTSIEEGRHKSFCIFPLPHMYQGVKVDKAWIHTKMAEDLKKRSFTISEDSPITRSLRISWDLEPDLPLEIKKPEPTYKTLTANQLLRQYTNGIISEYTLSLQLPHSKGQVTIDLHRKLTEVHGIVKQLSAILLERLQV